jgi:hypothetical protein
VPLAGRLGGDNPAARKLHGGLRFPGTVWSVIAVNDGPGGGILRRLAGRQSTCTCGGMDGEQSDPMVARP